MKQKAIFIDKDGTLIKNVPYNADPKKIEFPKGVIMGLSLLTKLDYKLIIASNQSGVARGYFPVEKLNLIYDKIQKMLHIFNLKLDDFFFCPHAPSDGDNQSACSCRKPLPGLLVKASLKHEINLKESWMIGDILTDIEAGNRAGCKTILIDNGNETEWDLNERNSPDYIVASFDEAAFVISCHSSRHYV